ncbi:hypothetical protein [Magnetospirillum sulfuroxidans]|uniref:Uncharacterized protein n=1 Tax=Magnetospirillum sulfuroxidans TaxID=611300 RepID=A0ABS5IG04_9PROT|nr:hypothetical protein [Magnetospirillum sulfuroxidans]MBR9973320.1 hypothetical protein [Magnetospirillum sulfuroxidans]
MLPLLTFASGLVAGIVGVKLLKRVKAPDSLGNLGDKARTGLDKAQAGLRDATVTSLSAIEKSTATLRAKLAPEEQAAAEPMAEQPATVAKAKATPRRQPATKKKAAAPTAMAAVDAKPESDS